MSHFLHHSVMLLAGAVLLASCAAGGSRGAGDAAGDAPDADAKAQVPTGQHPQTLELPGAGGGPIRYLLYVPEGYAASEKPWPLVLFLHGAGERGDDLEAVKKHGPPKLVGEGKAFPFICVSPQCPKGGWWDKPEQTAALVALLDHLQKTLDVDADRVVLTGLSMGGFGTWALAMAEPKRFAALAPICGRGDPKKADRIAHIPAWVFHGAKDPTVPVTFSEAMVEALKKAGGAPKFTVYPEAKHDSWTQTYANPKFWEWLLAQRRGK